MFQTSKDLKAEIEAQSAELAQLEQELKEADVKIEALSDATQRVAELEAQLTESQEALAEESEAHLETQAALDLEREKTTPEAINALVTAEIAASGIPPIEQPTPEGSQITDGELVAKHKNATAQELINLKNTNPEDFNRLKKLQTN